MSTPGPVRRWSEEPPADAREAQLARELRYVPPPLPLAQRAADRIFARVEARTLPVVPRVRIRWARALTIAGCVLGPIAFAAGHAPLTAWIHAVSAHLIGVIGHDEASRSTPAAVPSMARQAEPGLAPVPRIAAASPRSRSIPEDPPEASPRAADASEPLHRREPRPLKETHRPMRFARIPIAPPAVTPREETAVEPSAAMPDVSRSSRAESNAAPAASPPLATASAPEEVRDPGANVRSAHVGRPPMPVDTGWACEKPAGAFGEARVLVRVRVTGAGEARDVEVIEAPGMVYAAVARACALKQRYEPGTDEDGIPLDGMTGTFWIHFK